MTVITEGSDCRILLVCDFSVFVIGRFKLSEIANIDQSLLLFEYQRGWTYVKSSEKTVYLKGQKSNWEKW